MGLNVGPVMRAVDRLAGLKKRPDDRVSIEACNSASVILLIYP